MPGSFRSDSSDAADSSGVDDNNNDDDDGNGDDCWYILGLGWVRWTWFGFAIGMNARETLVADRKRRRTPWTFIVMDALNEDGLGR